MGGGDDHCSRSETRGGANQSGSARDPRSACRRSTTDRPGRAGDRAFPEASTPDHGVTTSLKRCCSPRPARTPPATSPNSRPSWTASPPTTTPSDLLWGGAPLRRPSLPAPRPPSSSHPSPRRATTGSAETASTRVLLSVQDLDVRMITEDGGLLRQLTLDPSRDYQSLGS